MAMNRSILSKIAEKSTDIIAAINLTFLTRSYQTAVKLIDQGLISGVTADLSIIDPAALLWFLKFEESHDGYVPWHEIANLAQGWPGCDQLALLKLDKVDWGFEGILELGFLNNYWNYKEIMSEKIESWLWHYDDSENDYSDLNNSKVDLASSRIRFADAAIMAGAGTYWSISQEEMLKEERCLQRVTEILFA